MLPFPGPRAFNYIKQLLQYLDADSIYYFFFFGQQMNQASHKSMSLIEKCRVWQMGASVAAFWGSDREGLPKRWLTSPLVLFLGLRGAMYLRVWWRCNCSTHWQEGDNLGTGPHQLRFSGWIALLNSNGVSTAGRASQQKLQFGLLVCGIVCVPFVWLNVALLRTAGWGQKDPASAEGKPVVYCLLCLSAATPGIWRD